VFHLTQPTAAAIAKHVAAAGGLIAGTTRFLSLDYGVGKEHLPVGFAHDYSRSCIGHGQSAFEVAKRAFQRWAPFDIGWVRVANPEALITAGQIVAVEARSLGLWTLNLSRIAETVDAPARFGFLYVTTERHVEQGEERFLIQFDSATGDVSYELEAVSRPRQTLARLGLPITRTFQHRFARDSHQRMRDAILAESS
jgi:uncharacterized protein (UPF0548 family)